MSFEMIKVRVIWYSPNDESFREEYRPITEMHTNIFTEVVSYCPYSLYYYST